MAPAATTRRWLEARGRAGGYDDGAPLGCALPKNRKNSLVRSTTTTSFTQTYKIYILSTSPKKKMHFITNHSFWHSPDLISLFATLFAFLADILCYLRVDFVSLFDWLWRDAYWKCMDAMFSLLSTLTMREIICVRNKRVIWFWLYCLLALTYNMADRRIKLYYGDGNKVQWIKYADGII